MSLAEQPDTKTADISFQDAKTFLNDNDESDVVSRLETAELAEGLSTYGIHLEKTVQGADYKVLMKPVDEGAIQMVKDGDLQPYVSGTIDSETYKQFKGEKYGTRR